MREKNVIKEHSVECVDVETGEIKSTTNFTTRKVDAEPEFIKLYLADMSRWANLPTSTSNVLAMFLRYMNYENIIPLNACIKDSIAKELKTTRATVDNQLSKLCKRGLFTRVGTGTYLANPYVFGRGKWTEIKEIQATVKYDKDGITFSVITNPAKQLSLYDDFDRFVDGLKEERNPETDIDAFDRLSRGVYGKLRKM